MKINLKPFLAIPFLTFIVLTGCTDYGKKVSHGHVEVFYKDGINKEQAQKTADIFFSMDADNSAGTKKSMQLVKDKDSFLFRMVVDTKRLVGVEDDSFNALGNILSDSVFNSSPVNVDLTDENFKTIRTVHYKKMDFTEPMPTDSIK